MWPAAEELAARAFHHLARALIVVDGNGAVLAMNFAAQHLTGWTASDAVGRPCTDILEVRTERGSDLCGPDGALRQTLDHARVVEEPEALLFRLGTADDPVRISFAVSPLWCEGSDPGAVILIEDLTPAQQTLLARDALVLAASHELKTPITTLRTHSELLLDFELSERQRQEAALEIRSQVMRMEKLIEDILSVLSIESGRLPLELARVHLPRVLERVCQELEPMLEGRRLRTDAAESLPPVLGEAKKLHQILINLGTNAIKYSPPSSEVALIVRAVGAQVRVEVRDQGVGIRKEDQERIFEKFFRANDPAVRRTHGTGLGLYIVRSLVEMLGGRVEVRSRRGQGTTILVWLQRADADPVAAPPPNRAPGRREWEPTILTLP